MKKKYQIMKREKYYLHWLAKKACQSNLSLPLHKQENKKIVFLKSLCLCLCELCEVQIMLDEDLVMRVNSFRNL